MYKRIALAAALVATFALGASALGVAGNGNGPNKSSSINLVMVSSSALSTSASSGPHFGDTVTFDVSTTESDKPSVRLNCSQNGAAVYWASAGFFPEYPWPWARNFALSSDYWSGGAADCTATLYGWDGKRFRDLAAMSFSVAA